MRERNPMPLEGSWVLIKRSVPTQIKPHVLGLYFGEPVKNRIFVEGETSTPWAGHCDGSAMLREMCFRPGSRSIRNAVFRDYNHALRTLWLYQLGQTEGMDERALAEFKSTDLWPNLEHRLQIMTADGDVCIEPHEYNRIADVTPYLECIGNEYEVEFLGGDYDDAEFKERMFYCAQRGIKPADAMTLMLGDIKARNVCYLKPHPDLAGVFGLPVQ